MLADSNATVPTGLGWPSRRPRYTIVQISDPHVPADGFLFDRVDACARVQASVEMIAAAGCSPDVLVLSTRRRRPRRGSPRARVLLDDRGWSSGASIAQPGLRYIADTARMVVGPDGPGPGETDEQMEIWHWDWLARKLVDAGIGAEAVELKALPHDVEIGPRLGHHLAERA